MSRLRSVALVGILPLLLIACAQPGTGGQGGGPGSGGTTGSGGATGGSGGMAIDAGVDMAPLLCRIDTDCPSGATCVPPGAVICPRTCAPTASSCTVDTDCPRGQAIPLICAADGCTCNATSRCVPGCVSDSDCWVEEVCQSDHHCVTVACGTTFGNCPTNTTCNTNQGWCFATACTSDSQCQGACVGNRCYPKPGTCQFQGP